MSDEHKIETITESVSGASGPGERLEMADGSIWFHPYSGGAPICERKSDTDRLRND